MALFLEVQTIKEPSTGPVFSRVSVVASHAYRLILSLDRRVLCPVFGSVMCLLVLPFGMAAPVAQTPQARTPASKVKASASQSQNYVLGAGDVLRIVVESYPEYNQDSVAVPPDGIVTMPRLGTLRLSGKTRLQVQEDVKKVLSRRVGMRTPLVAVSITTFRPDIVRRVVLSGDVPKPGVFQITPGQRLSELLADAGVQERLEEQQATLTRRSGATVLNLKAAALSPRSSADIVLQPGDTITVKRRLPGRITLTGDVTRPGIYELHNSPRIGADAMEVALEPRLSDLLTQAGGLASERNATFEGATLSGNEVSPSAPTQTSYTGYLQRGGMRLVLDPESALSQRNGVADIKLRPGDVVTIQVVRPLKPLTVYLDGLVARAGEFKVPPGSGVLELLTTAGGLTKAPEEVVASVRRGAQILPLDLPKLLLSSESNANLQLQNGDIVQLRAPETITIQVAGQVAKPGPFQLKPGATILEALLAAGGLSVPVEEARLSVLHKETDGSQRILEANAAGILGLRDISTNAMLHEGDLVNVARIQRQTVFISGQVNSPGPFELRAGEGIAQLVTRAGGVKDDAILTRLNVQRAGKMLQVDAYEAVKNGQPLDFVLQDGDSVVVPQNLSRVVVMEAVAKPGYYTIPERGRLTLLDVLAQAQPVPRAGKVIIMRAAADGSIDRTKEPREIKLDDVRRGKVDNAVLAPRDIVFVPSPKDKQSLLSVLGTVGTLRFLFPF